MVIAPGEEKRLGVDRSNHISDSHLAVSLLDHLQPYFIGNFGGDNAGFTFLVLSSHSISTVQRQGQDQILFYHPGKKVGNVPVVLCGQKRSLALTV